MSVYIKGMEMPIDCYGCLLSSEFNLYEEDGYCVSGMECPLLNQVIDDDSKRLPDCPLIPVPDHGRLVDADAMQDEWYRLNFDHKISDGTLAYWNFRLSQMPTIIPGEEVDK